MGFLFFLIFVIIICIVMFLCLILLASMFFFMVGTISLILGKTKQRKGNKTILVKLSIVFFVISFVCMSVIFGFVLLMRANNKASYDEYVDTGKVLVMTEQEMEKGFELDGEKFVLLGDDYDSEKAKKREAICNILSQEIEEAEQFINHLLNYNPYDTLYEIENDSGFPLYANNNRVVCCREKDYDKIQNFYQKKSKMKYFYEKFNEVGEGGAWTGEEQRLLHVLFEKPNPQWEIKVFHETEVTGEYNIVRQSEDSIYTQRAYIFFTEKEVCLWCSDDINDIENKKENQRDKKNKSNKEGSEEEDEEMEEDECIVGYRLDEELRNCIRKNIK